jgi:hypothetical protein
MTPQQQRQELEELEKLFAGERDADVCTRTRARETSEEK